MSRAADNERTRQQRRGGEAGHWTVHRRDLTSRRLHGRLCQILQRPARIVSAGFCVKKLYGRKDTDGNNVAASSPHDTGFVGRRVAKLGKLVVESTARWR